MMSGQQIEQWEKEQAEVAIRRWLIDHNLWAPEAERARPGQLSEPPFNELTPEQIDRILRSEHIGRIGCHAGGKTYVVPMSYVYDGQAIYGHTGDGMKLRMMRENPDVCFEVDRAINVKEWQSVICWGRFEELHGEDARRALQLLVEHVGQSLPAAPVPKALQGHWAVVYRIVLTRVSGRSSEP